MASQAYHNVLIGAFQVLFLFVGVFQTLGCEGSGHHRAADGDSQQNEHLQELRHSYLKHMLSLMSGEWHLDKGQNLRLCMIESEATQLCLPGAVSVRQEIEATAPCKMRSTLLLDRLVTGSKSFFQFILTPSASSTGPQEREEKLAYQFVGQLLYLV